MRGILLGALSFLTTSLPLRVETRIASITRAATSTRAMAPGAFDGPGAAIPPPELDGRLILAACRTGAARGIGLRGDLPWPRLREDLRRFAAVTRSAAVVMGRATYESLPDKARPLPGRLNVVLSSQTRDALCLPDGVLLAGSLDAAETLMRAHGVQMPFYVIGGADVFAAALARPAWSRRIYYTDVQAEFECDRVFEYDLDAPTSDFELLSVSQKKSDGEVPFVFKEYARRGGSTDSAAAGSVTGRNVAAAPSPPRSMSYTHPEMQYLSLIDRILETGVSRGDRTGTGTHALFGETMRFDLRDSFPLLTTKRVFWRGVAEELLWFVSGSTNANLLSEKGVHIWDGNGSREFLDARGFPDREVGDLGPVYGFQWRHFGAKYVDMHTDYTGQGVDQVAEVIETIKTRPTDRRMILSAWNPSALNDMALPPCHMMAQFFVADGELSCMMYQRSCDVGLGVPFNIASYALLTRMLARVTGLAAGAFVHVLGDAHVYNNHVEALREQARRKPRPFPQLDISDREDLRTIDDFVMKDFALRGYDPHKAIKMQMAV
jgi:dihydrofolate reductase / thymidylate synthase